MEKENASGRLSPLSSLAAVAAILQDKADPALLDFGATRLSAFFGSLGEKTPPVLAADGTPLRWQDKVIEGEIPRDATVLDLGCGDGGLLQRLAQTKEVRGQGVELDLAQVSKCIRRGVPVLHSDIRKGLRDLADASFDYVILEETLQTLRQPVEVLNEMLRVGKRGVVSFPNFAFWKVRFDFAIRGRMPQTGWLPHTWYDTPNIHNLSIRDFLLWSESAGVRIVAAYVLDGQATRPLEMRDNLDAEEALMIIERNTV